MIPASGPVLLASNRGYRYGDGLFETMKLVRGNIQLGDYHFNRLLAGIALLQMEVPPAFSRGKIEEDIRLLANQNNCHEEARVRLSVFRGNNFPFEAPGQPNPDEGPLEYLLECWPLQPQGLNEKGLAIDIFPDARKSCDAFSNLKSANYLCYVMAGRYARSWDLDDCLLLNTEGMVADSTISNIFLLSGGEISTPALSEGCVAGVMRRYLISILPGMGYPVTEKKVSVADLEKADEVFLTNAISGMRWVKTLKNKEYGRKVIEHIYENLSRTIPI